MCSTTEKFKADKSTTHILNKYIYDFICTLRKDKEINENTVYVYIKYVEMFDRYLFHFKPQLTITEINEDIVNAYTDFCRKDLNNTNKTINSKINTLTKFFGYLTKEHKIYEYNFMFNINLLENEEEQAPTVIHTSDLLLLFNVMKSYIYGYRDIVITRLILETGLYTNEVLNLKSTQFSMENRCLTYNIGNTVKSFNLSSNLIYDLKQYLLLRNTFRKNDSNYIFISIRGKKYSMRSYQLFFLEAVKRCDFAIKYSPRHLRSTFLYNMSKLVPEYRLKDISSQDHLKHYYELSSNPLRNLY